MIKKWETISQLQGPLQVDQIIKTLLQNRGLKGKKQVEEFLHPADPYALKPEALGIKKAAITQAIKRIKKAIKQKEQIIVYGDYDADGICATAILWETLHRLGAKTLPFIPQRKEHGYGLNQKGIDTILKDKKVSLIITVDNGIVAYDGVKYAQKKGIEVIITDHHQMAKKLPAVLAIIHSTQVSGSGVSWFLAKEIYLAFHKNLKGFKASSSLELACIGTITDMMPMLAANRSLVKFGLQELQQSQRPGIRALCQQAVIDQKIIESYHIGYILGPRLNAMGRLEEALESLRLLCTQKEEHACNLAFKLNSINKQRQQLTQETFSSARKKFKTSSKEKLIFISDKTYNPGVIGLVAGKLVEEFYRPAIVISQGEEFSKSSIRSVKGFDMIKFLRQFEEDFEDLGGHPMAAGFTVKTSQLKALRQKLEKAAQKQLPANLLKPVLRADLEISLADINWDLHEQIEKFAPFGLANPRPTFITRQVKVLQVRAVGREQKHLKLKLVGFEAIAFSLGHFAGEIKSDDLIDICYTLEKNEWNGNTNLELKVKDIRIESDY